MHSNISQYNFSLVLYSEYLFTPILLVSKMICQLANISVLTFCSKFGIFQAYLKERVDLASLSPFLFLFLPLSLIFAVLVVLYDYYLPYSAKGN